jgi:putative ABC transport system permease protein
MRNLLQEIRYSIRTLSKSPGFTIIAVTALALGIGANTAIFSLVNAVLVRPLPFHQAEQLVEISERSKDSEWLPVDYSDFLDWRRQNQAFESMAITANFGQTLTGRGPAENIQVSFVSASFFQMLGIRPLIGRGFAASEDEKGAGPVAILTYPFWQSHFGGRHDAIGQTMTLSGRTYTVAGVLPASFRYHRSADVYAPFINCVAAFGMDTRGNHNNAWVLARQKPGVAIKQVRAQMDTITRRIAAEYPGTNTGVGATVRPFRELLAGGGRRSILVLFGAVTFVLLIACANVANLLLARSAARQKEIAIRAALGAGRMRLIRQLLTESLLLFTAGASLGLILAKASFALLTTALPWGFDAKDLSIDLPVLAFTFALALLTGAIFGLAPAFQVSRVALSETMKEGGRAAAAGSVRARLRSALVVAEVALAMVLLVGAGLLMNSFYRLLNVNTGYNPENVIAVQLSWSYSDISALPKLTSFYERLVARVQTLPGVRSAGAIWPLPLSGGSASAEFYLEGKPIPARGQFPEAPYYAASPEYFRTMGIPLLKGRIYTEADGKIPPITSEEAYIKWFKTAQVAGVISESMARRYWPNEDPIGKRFRFGTPDMGGYWVTVLGVVADARNLSLDKASPHYYVSSHQRPNELALVIRIAGDPTALAGAIRGVVKELDCTVPVTSVRTMEKIMGESVASRRTNVLLIGIFAALAVVLAAVGIYGVVAYMVNQRKHEIGIRMALGAARSDVLAMVLKQAAMLGLAGVAIGGAGALAATRVLSSMLYGITATDPVTFAAVSALLLGVVLVASCVPARRATRVDPLVALRCE